MMQVLNVKDALERIKDSIESSNEKAKLWRSVGSNSNDRSAGNSLHLKSGNLFLF